MGDTSIAWTNKTWNPVVGCTKVAAGCKRCYAESMHRRFSDRPFSEVVCHPERLLQPLSWRQPQTVFITSMGDLWHQDVPVQTQVDVMGVVLLAHWIRFIDLTKRSAARRRFFEAGDHGIVAQFAALQQHGGWADKRVWRALGVKQRDGVPLTWPPPNYIAGSSVSTRADLDDQIPDLLATPVPVRALSAEPLLEDLAGDPLFSASLCSGYEEPPHDDIVNWVIVGGESSSAARRCEVQWIRDIVKVCHTAATPCFVKQLGRVVWGDGDKWPNPYRLACQWWPFVSGGSLGRRNLRAYDGSDVAEWPEDLCVRQFPWGAK